MLAAARRPGPIVAGTIRNAALALLVPAAVAAAQDVAQGAAQGVAPVPAPAATSAGAWELRINSGGFIATGAQRGRIKDAPVSALQVSWLAAPRLAITGTLAWARTRDVGTADAPRLDVFNTDIGVEARATKRALTATASLGAFAGAGAGVRSYDYRNVRANATHNAAGYVAAGGEVGYRRVALRLEARDYVTGFKAIGNDAATGARNDVVVMATLRFNHRTPGNN